MNGRHDPFHRTVLLIGGLLAAMFGHSPDASAQESTKRTVRSTPVPGDAVIRGRTEDSEIVITTTSRLAGAIHSLKWKGREFIDSTDHGRQLQSAANFDAGSRFSGETFNPTEAGSRLDGAGPRSTSRLLHIVHRDNYLQTTTQMAHWLAPGQKSGGQPAKNPTRLSDHLLTKRVRIGYADLPQVISYDVTFGMPVGEHHRYAQFEAVTGYMPAEFRLFRVYDAASDSLKPISDGPGEQALPVVLSTEDGQYAMGVYSPDQPSTGYDHAGYGRFRFAAQRVVKWNCVFRIADREGVPAGDYSFRCFVIVGNAETVKNYIRRLMEITAQKQAL